MSIDLTELVKGLGGIVSDKVRENVEIAGEHLTPADVEIVERAGRRKVEILIASALGQDTKDDEAQIETTLGFLAAKAKSIAKETVKNTFLDSVKEGGKFVFKLVLKSIIP